MKFSVTFRAFKNNYLVDSKTTKLGLVALNQVREKLGVNIDAKLLSSSKKRGNEYACTVELTEQQAIESGRFDLRSEIDVFVSHDIVEKCIIEELKVSRNSTTDAIEYVEIIEKVSPEKLFETWQNYGYSLELPIPTAIEDEESEA